MHSNHSTNARCSKFGSVINLSNKRKTPLIDRDDVLKGSFLNDRDILLDKIATNTSIASSPSAMTHFEEEAKKPRACRDLRVLVREEKCEELNGTEPGACLGLRERLESYLDVELASQEEENEDMEPGDKENMNANINKKNLRTHRSTKKARGGQEIKKEEYSPVVWVIEPRYHKDGTLRFKFTTDAGACLILKDKEALASIDMMKASARSNTYFQVYSLQGHYSRVMKPDRVSQTVIEMIAESKPTAQERDILTNNPKRGLRHRFYRFLLRRRWKHLLRRKVCIAACDSNNCNRFVSMAVPFARIWRRTGRRNRTSSI